MVEPPPPKPRRRWRLLGGFFLLIGGVGLVIALVLLVASVAVRTSAGQRWVADQIEALVDPAQGSLTIGALETDLFSHARASDVTLARDDGQPVIHVDTLDLDYRLGGLIGGVLVLPKVHADGVEIALTVTEAGLDFLQLWEDGVPSTGPWRGLGINLVAPDVAITGVNATVHVAPTEFYSIRSANLHLANEFRLATIIIHDLSLEAAEATHSRTAPAPVDGPSAPPVLTALGAVSLEGNLRYDPTTLWMDRLWLAIGPNHLSVQGGLGRLDGDTTIGFAVSDLHIEAPAIQFVAGPVPLTGAFEGQGTVAGLLENPHALLEVTTPGGEVHAEASIDTRVDPVTWVASLAMRDVDLHAFLPDAPDPAVVRGLITIDGSGLSWPEALDARGSFRIESPRFDAMDTIAVDGTLTLSHGVVTIERTAGTLPGASVRTSGRIDLLNQVGSTTGTVASLDLTVLRRLGVDDLLGHVDFQGDTTFGWGAQLAVTARGAVRGAAVGLSGVAEAGAARGPVDVRWTQEGGVEATFGLGLTRLEGQGFTAEQGRADLLVTVDPQGDVGVVGTAQVASIVGPDTTGQQVDLDLRLTRSASGQLDGFAEAQTSGLAWQGYTSDTGTAKVRFSRDVAAIDVALLDGTRTFVGVDAEVDLAARSLRARRVELAPTAALAWRSEGVQTLRIVDGGVADVHLRFSSGEALLAVDGYGAKKALIDLRAEVQNLRLESLAQLLPGVFEGYSGLVTVRSSFEGHASRPALLVDVKAKHLTVPGALQDVDLDAQGVGGDRRLQVEGRLDRGAKPLVYVVGDIPFSLAIDSPGLLTDGDMEVHFVLPPSDSVVWRSVLAVEDIPTLRASAELVVSGPVLDPALQLVATVDVPSGQRGDWVRFDVDADTVDRKLTARVVGRERYERRVEVAGQIELLLGEVADSLAAGGPPRDLGDPASWVSAIELDLVPLRLPVQTLTPFVEGFPTGLTGDLVGGVHVSGTLAALKLEGALLLAGGKLGELGLSPAMVTLAPTTSGEGAGYRVDVNLGFGGGSTALIGGFVPLDLGLGRDMAAELQRPGLALVIDAQGVPLTAVSAAWPQMVATAGLLRADGKVIGSVAHPQLAANFGLDDGDFVLVPTNVHYREASVSGHYADGELRVDDLSAITVRRRVIERGVQLDPGRVTGKLVGRMVADRPVVEGELRLDRAWIVDVRDRVLRVDGVLNLSDRDDRVNLTGRVGVTEGSIVLPERFFSSSGDLTLDPDVQVIRAGAADPEITQRQDAFTLPKWIDARVTVDLARNTFLDATVPLEQVLGDLWSSFSTINVNAQLDGAVEVIMRDGVLSLVGELQPIRGRARVLSVPFELQGGTISFTGIDYTEPVLDIQAMRVADDHTIDVAITGTPSNIGLALSSPDLAQDDILSILILGRPLSEAGGSDPGALLAAASAVLGQQMVGTRSRAFDVFEIDSQGDLRIGRRLRDNVFLIGETDWSAATATDGSKANVIEITLEVQLDRYWQFDFTTGTAGVTTAGLNRTWRF